MSTRRSKSRRYFTRVLRRNRNRARLFETLEPRMMLNADWQNPSRPLDVNNDWMVTPMDALLVINHLNSGGSKALPVRSNRLDFYYDVNGDQLFSPMDALLVINQLNQGGARGLAPTRIEGEAGVSPAGFISIPMARSPGAVGQLVPVSTSMDVGREEFNEMGLFVVDGPDGAVHGILPSSPDYAAAVFQSSQRQVLYSRGSVCHAMRELVFPAGQYINVYVLQQSSSNGNAADHLRARESASGNMQIGWDEQISILPNLPIVGDRGYDDVTVNVEFGEPFDGNAQPVIAAIPNRTIDELTELSIQLTATHSDSAPADLTWSKVSGPTGLQVDSQSGLLTWTPLESDGPGQFEVTVSVFDGALSDSRSFMIRVDEVNVAPAIAHIDEQVVDVGTTLSITAVATDADIPSNALTYRLDVSPTRATIDSQSGLIQWSPSAAGQVDFVVGVTDAGGLFATTSFRVTAGENLLLSEGTAFQTELSRVITLPNDTSALRVTFEAPTFDFSSKQTIRDAFEIEVTDLDGKPVAFPYAPNRDAVYNWSEGLEPVFGVGVATTTNPAGQESSATISLSGLAAGSRIRVSARLVNNDSDTATSVIIRGFEIVDAPSSRPTGMLGLANQSFAASSILLSDLSELSANFLASYGRTTLAADNTDLVTQLTVTNNSRETIVGRIVVAIGNMSEPDAQVLQPDGFLQDGRPYIDLSQNLAGGVLEPGASSTSREVRFRNLSGQRFAYQLSFLGMLNRAPSDFSTSPLDSIQAGRVYRYQASASDPENAALRYSIIVGPDQMTIDESTGALTWPTQTVDIGSHPVILRATDPYQVAVDQSFAIQVLASQPNRPPVFTSVPGTEATAASAFEVLSLATGDSPSGLAVGDFGSGNLSLVAIDQGAQSLSFLEGLGADKFADRVTVSVGEPPPTGEFIRSGVDIDLGLPPYLSPTYDQNFLDGFTTADFNGDGILDTAAIARTQYRDLAYNDHYDRFLVVNLGKGDGTFADPSRFSFPGFNRITNGSAMLAMDFDCDGLIDLLALDTQQYVGQLSRLIFYKGLGDGTFAAAQRTDSATPVFAMQSADFNGDGILDLLVESSSQNSFGIQLGSGDGTFGSYQQMALMPAGGYSIFAFSFGDLDDDGDLDVVVADWGLAALRVFYNHGDASFSNGPELLARMPLSSGSTPNAAAAVIIGDFTGDGYADIAYTTANANVGGGGIGLYTGDAAGNQFTFLQAQTDRIPARPVSRGGNATPVDIDRDGDLDLLFISQDLYSSISQGVIVGLNDGVGHFTTVNYLDATSGYGEQIVNPNSSNIIGALLGDFNRDGMLDILSAETNITYGHDFSGLSVLLADRPGVFRTPSAFPLEKAAYGSVEFTMAGDFNNDGITDLWGPQYQGVSITRLGNGDGTFRPGLTATPYIGNEGLAPGFVADLNNDGNQDVVWIGGGGIQGGPRPRYLAALGNGDGTFQITFVQDAVTRVIEPGDFNDDGFMDFAARGDSNSGPYVELMLGDPSVPGTFIQSMRVQLDPQQENSAALTVNDFDGDGQLDIAVVLTDSNKPPHRLLVYHGNGDGTLSAPLATSILANTELLFPKWMASADLNHDGFMDIVVSASYSRSAVFLGNNDGTFRDPMIYVSGTYFASNRNILISDVDGDGNIDLINFNDNPDLGQLTVRPGLGDGTFGVEQVYDNLSRSGELASGDFDNDGRTDFVIVDKANYGEAVVYTGGRPGLTGVVAAQINDDNWLDVLAINNDNSHVKRLLGNAQGGFTRLPDLLVGPGPVALTTGDFNGDAKLDFVTANRSGNSLSIMLADASGFYTRSDIQLDATPIDVQVADVNHDGKLDILALDTFHNSIQLLLGNDGSTFQGPHAIALGDQPAAFTLSDVDNDGNLDAVITLPNSSRVMLLSGNGDGTFSNPSYVATPSPPTGVAAADLNLDGFVDLAISLPEEDQVALLLGIGHKRFAAPQAIHAGDTPNSIAIQDANQDGRLDIMVTNSGDDTVSIILNKYDPTQVYRYTVVAMDPDDDSVEYTLSSGPGGMIFDAQSGELQWAPTADQVGLQQVTLQASDGRGGTATQQFTIAVEPARSNAPPVFTSQPNKSVAADGTFAYTSRAVDNDSDPIRYRLVDAPAGASIDPISGEVQWDPRSGALRTNESVDSGGVEIPNSASLDVSSFTLEGWFEFESTGNQKLIWKDVPYQYPLDLASYAIRYQWGALIAIIGDGTGAGQAILNYPWTPNIGQAYHLAATFDSISGSLKLLINGTSVAELTTDKRITNSALPLYLGFNNSDPFRGTMSRVRIWDTARSAAEILAGMDRAFASATPNLIADYRFLEGDSQSVVDTSGHQSNGKLIGSGWPRRIAGIAPISVASFTLSAEDGRGGFDVQSFDVQIAPRLRGSLAGTVYSDTNGDGIRQTSEAPLEGWVIYLDTNGNGLLDNAEASTATDVDGSYHFADLLAGKYSLATQPRAGFVHVVPRLLEVVSQQMSTAHLAVTPQALGQIRGTVYDDNAVAIAHMQVFADLDRDGVFDANEPAAWIDGLGQYALAGLPVGSYSVRVDSRPGWTTTSPASAQHDIALATDQLLADVDFTVTPQNESSRAQPVILSSPSTSATARSRYSDFVVASDPNGSSIDYSLSVAPSGMVIDATTGRIVWTPVASQIGSQRVIVRAKNELGRVAMLDFSIDVAPPNSSPVVTSEPSKVAVAASPWTYAIEAQDAEQSTLHYTLISGPATASLNADSGLLRWVPTSSDVGDHGFVIAVVDGVGGETEQTFMVNVQTTSVPTQPFQVRAPRSETSLLSMYLSRIDGVDAIGQALSTELLTGPSGLTLDSTGLIQWSPTVPQLGLHTIAVRFHSPGGSLEDKIFALDVRQVVANTSPEIISTPISLATIGGLFRYDIVAEDRDHDALAFELLSAPAGMSINPSTGSIRWQPAQDQLGSSSIAILASDPQGGSATQTFSLTTRTVGGPPSIVSIPPTQAVVGQGYLYSVASIDAEHDPLQFSLLEAPTGMTIDAQTGEIAWTPSATQLGQQSVIISVSDLAGGTTTQGYAVIVLDGAPNLPPTITSNPVLIATVDQAYSYDLSASDPEGTTLIYTLRRAPVGMQLDSNTGHVSWTPTNAQSGRFVVTVVATDVAGGAGLQSYQLDVLSVNHGPIFVSTPPTKVYAGTALKYDLVARDDDLDPLKYEIVSGAPSGMSLDVLGRLRWSTTTTDLGDFSIQVRVSDPRGGTATQSIPLQVIADDVVPKVTVLPTPGGWPWQGPIVVFVSAVDNVGVSQLELKVNGRVVALDAHHVARLYADDWGFGTLNMVATARDAAGNVGLGSGVSFYRNPDIDYEANPAVPTAIVTSPIVDESVVGMVRIEGTAAGPDFKEYRLFYARTDKLEFVEFAHATIEVQAGLLGTWDTTLLENDAYIIRLEVTDLIGSTNVVDVTVGLSGALKLGNFRLSFEDMTIPMAGIPITIVRTYDTLRADRQGDFGYGWRLEYRDTDLRTSLPKSGLEDIGIYTPFKQGTKVYLTLPGGERQGFTFTPDYRVLSGFGPGNDLVIAFPRFTPDRGVTSTLSAGGGSLLANEFGEMYAAGGIPWNPASPDFAGYTLTTAEGIQYHVDGATGLMTSASDRNGNNLQFGDNGIQSSNGGLHVTFEYDANGRIASITDPAGEKVLYTYSKHGDLIQVTDRNKNATTIEYTALHFLDRVIDPLGRTGVRAEYDSNGRLTGTVGADGRISISYDPANSLVTTHNHLNQLTLSEYDSQGNLVSVTDALGHGTHFEYDDFGNPTSTTNALNQTTIYKRDGQGNLTQVIDALGNTSFYTYTTNRLPTTITDATGSTWTTQYDSKGNAVVETDPLGRTVTSTYDSAGNILSHVGPLGDVNTMGYDAAGHIISTSAPNGFTVEYQYDANGNMVGQSTNGQSLQVSYSAEGQPNGVAGLTGQAVEFTYDAVGRITFSPTAVAAIEYDKGDRPIAVTLASGTKIGGAKFDAEGQQVSAIDPFGGETFYEYDDTGKLIRTLFPNGGIEVREYNAIGQLIALTDPLGNIVHRAYDAVGNLVEITDPLGGETTYVYDSNGRLTSETDADGNSIRTVYDAAGQVIANIDSAGSTTTRTYDLAGRLASVIDPVGRATRYRYDSSGRLSDSINAIGGVTHYEYVEGSMDQIASITDTLGHVTRYKTDSFGRVTQAVLPTGETTSIRYSDEGLVLEKTAGSSHVTYTYDQNGLRTSTVLSDASYESYSYTIDWLLETSTNASGTTHFEYDPMTRRPTKVIEPDGRSIRYEYDLNGNRILLATTGPSGLDEQIVRYQYDENGRLSQLTDTSGGNSTFHYTLAGRLLSIDRPNGVESKYAYDLAGRLLRIEEVDGSSEVLASWSYTYDSNGARLSETAEDGSKVEYTYDGLGRIASELHLQSSGVLTALESYAYDAAGNLIAKQGTLANVTYDYDASNRLISSNDGRYEYDAAGMLSSFIDKSGQVTEYRFDDLGSLVEVKSPAEEITYKYDFDGRRISRGDAAGRIDYVVDRFAPNRLWQTVRETDSSGNTVRLNTVFQGGPFSIEESGQVTYLHRDASGSIRLTTDGSGVVSGTTNYTAYGEALNTTGEILYGFAGERIDSSLKTYDLRARIYEPSVGRFLSSDPIAARPLEPRSSNAYLYALGDPVNLSDPSGQITLMELQQVLVQKANEAREQSYRFLKAYNVVNRTLGITASRAGGILIAAGITEPVLFGRSIMKFFGPNPATAMKAVFNTFQTGIDLLGGKNIDFANQPFPPSYFATSEKYKGSPIALYLRGETNQLRVVKGSNYAKFALMPSFLYVGLAGISRSMFPISASGEPSMAGIMVHEMTHATLNTADIQYLNVNLALGSGYDWVNAFYGKVGTSTQALRNADSYRVAVESFGYGIEQKLVKDYLL